jgi:hypothetical protein
MLRIPTSARHSTDRRGIHKCNCFRHPPLSRFCLTFATIMPPVTRQISWGRGCRGEAGDGWLTRPRQMADCAEALDHRGRSLVFLQRSRWLRAPRHGGPTSIQPSRILMLRLLRTHPLFSTIASLLVVRRPSLLRRRSLFPFDLSPLSWSLSFDKPKACLQRN